jgi:potassium-dependent mechanosensitive channel
VVEIRNNIGRIADISLRCVRIYTEEKIDIIIPNSVALNECLINWTRTDNVIYSEIPISIAYSSDVDKATELMKKAALKAEGVLADPPPIVLFKSHGPFALNFVILCAVEVHNKLELWEKESSANYSINRHLRENGIKIAYPQSDIYFNTDKPIDIKLSR